MIGQGSYAIVSLAETINDEKIPKKKVAIKVLDKMKLYNPEKMENVENEIRI